MTKRSRTTADSRPAPASGARTPRTADLEAVRDQLRAEIREAREVLSDLRAAIKDGRAYIAEDVEAKVDAALTPLFTAMTKDIKDNITRTEDHVNRRFDTLVDNILRDSQKWRSAGEMSMREMLTVAHATGHYKPGDIPRMAAPPNLREALVEDEQG